MQVRDRVTLSAAEVPVVDTTPIPSVRAAAGRSVAIRMAIGLCIGTGLILTFLQLVNLRAVYRRLEHLNVILAVLCGVVFLSAYAVRALRWRWFLAPDVVAIPRIIAVYLVAIFLNWLLPVQGGELAKSLMLRRSNGIPVSRSLATVSMDKAMDVLPAVVLLGVVPFAGWRLGQPLWLLLVLASVAFVVGLLVLGLASWRRDRTLACLSRVLAVVLPRRVWERVAPFLAQFVDTLLTLVRKPRLLLIAAAYTMAAVCLDALFCFLAFRAVGASVSVPVVLYGYTFYNLAYILPTPPGHIGSNELIGLLIFSDVFGVSRSAVGAMFLFSHPWTAILMTVSGLLCLRAIGLKIRATLTMGSDTEPTGRQ
jgi:uncharacterized protein (TIRG00374 family)